VRFRHSFHLGRVGQVDDQGVEGRPRLGLEDPGDRIGIEGVGPQAVDRLGGKGDEPTVLEGGRRFGDRARGIGLKQASSQAGLARASPPRV
jgi:hypothetical protein